MNFVDKIISINPKFKNMSFIERYPNSNIKLNDNIIYYYGHSEEKDLVRYFFYCKMDVENNCIHNRNKSLLYDMKTNKFMCLMESKNEDVVNLIDKL